MNAPTEHQIILYNGVPAFAIIPYAEYLQFTVKPKEKVYFPSDVVQKHALEGKSLVRAWCEYKGLSQEEVARQLKISQPAYAKMEKPSSRLRLTTKTKISAVLGISPAQLTLTDFP